MKSWIENNTAIFLFLFCVSGLVIPGLNHIPSVFVLILLMVVVFFACFHIDFDEVKIIQWRFFSIFYFLRFIILPIILYFLIVHWNKEAAEGLLLFTLLPPAAASPVICNLYRGNVSLSFAYLVVANLLTPISLPLVFLLLSSKGGHADMSELSYTLALTIIIPICGYFFLRKLTPVSTFVGKKGSLMSIFLIGIAIAISYAKRKSAFLHEPIFLLKLLFISSCCFFLLYVIGWVFGWRAPVKNKISLSLTSGLNNISIGIGLALLYFSTTTSLFLILAQIPWTLSLMPFKKWLGYVEKR